MIHPERFDGACTCCLSVVLPPPPLLCVVAAPHLSSASLRQPHSALSAPSPGSCDVAFCAPPRFALPVSSMLPRSVPPTSTPPASSTHHRRALRADEPPFAQAEGDVALKAYVAILCFICFMCFERMLQVLQVHVSCVCLRMLQQRYCTCFNSNSSMFHWYIAHVAVVGSKSVRTGANV